MYAYVSVYNVMRLGHCQFFWHFIVLAVVALTELTSQERGEGKGEIGRKRGIGTRKGEEMTGAGRRKILLLPMCVLPNLY